MYPSPDSPASLYGIGLGVGWGYFYCIEISQYSWNFHHIHFPPFSHYISSLHIGCFFNFSAIPISPFTASLNCRREGYFGIGTEEDIKFKYF